MVSFGLWSWPKINTPMHDLKSDVGVNWDLVESWTNLIAQDELSPIRKTFRRHDAGGPNVIWSLKVDEIEQATLRFLFAYWSRLAQADALPLATRIDPIEMRPALGYVMLLEVVDGGRDFRYRVFGTEIAEVSGFDMTGRLLSEHRASPYIVEFALAAYRAAVVRRGPLFTEHWPSGTRHTASWQRLVLPLTNLSGEVVRFLAATVPLSRDGIVVRARF